MNESNTRKGLKNVLFGFISQIVTIALGIIIPRLFLVGYGSEMNGLLNSVSQVFTYMALLEAGVGAATTQALYRALGRKNQDSVNGILAATHFYYRRIGVIYLCCVFALSFFYPLAIESNIPFWTIAGIIFLNGISGAIAFFFQGKFQLLLQADGRSYFLTNVNLFVHIAVSLLKIVLILRGSNILFIQTVYMLLNLAKMLIISAYVKKAYPWINLGVRPDVQAISQKSSAFIHQISDLVFRNTDVLVLTFAPGCGLLTVSVYTMYAMLFGMISTAINTLGSGIEFIMGQMFHKDFSRYSRIHDAYETYGMAVIFSLYTVAYIFISPFLRIYTAGVNDINYIDRWLPLLFVLTFFMSGGRRASAIVINFAQHFKKTQGRAIAEAIINLSSSILLVFKFGIYGVLLGTIVGLLYRTNDMILYSNHVILKRSAWPTYRRWLLNLAVFFALAYLAKQIPWQLDSYLSIIWWAAVSGVVICGVYCAASSLTNPNEYKLLREYASPMIKKVLKKT